MEIIKKLIESFIEKEYVFTINRYDINVSDDDCHKLAEELNNIFSELNAANYRRTGREFRNESKKQFSIENRERATPRTLFQIKHYKDFELGDALKRIVTGQDLYACYVSYPSKGSRELYFSSIFYIAETNEGLKIVYEKSFNSDTGVWYHPVDIDVTTVISEGNLVAVEKYQAPEEATSLLDYNKE